MNMKFRYIAYNTSLVLKDIGKKLTTTKCTNVRTEHFAQIKQFRSLDFKQYILTENHFLLEVTIQYIHI